MATQNSSNIPTTNNTLPYGNGTGFSTISAANNSVLITSGGGVPSMSATLPSAVQGNITSLGTNGTMGSGWASTAAVSGSNNTFTLRNTGTTTNSNARLLIQSGTNSNNAAVSYLFLEATLSTGSNLFSVAVDTADAKIKTYLGIPTTGNLIQSIDTAGNIFSPGTLSLGGTALLQNGSLSLSGGTSGTSTIQVPAVAGTSTLTLPTTNGTAGQALLGDGGAGTGYTWGDVPLYATSTWTPGLAFGGGTTGITYTTQAGEYTQIGNIVYFNCNIVLSNKGSSTGNVTITGLPVNTSANEGNNAVSINNFGNITLSVGNTLVSGVFSASGSTINLQQTSLTGTVSNISNTNFANTSQLTFSGFYFTS